MTVLRRNVPILRCIGLTVGGRAQTDPMPEFTARESAILEFESRRWASPGRRIEAIQVEFGCSETVYTAELLALLENPAALRHAPLTVRRLLRLRDARRAVRTGTQPDD